MVRGVTGFILLSAMLGLSLSAPAQARHQGPALDHHAVSTGSPAAQRAFDDGMMLRYAFNNVAAAAAFERAAALDPHLAMAYWGIALSDGVDINTPPAEAREAAAAKAIDRAVTLLPYASPVERDYIEALAQRYSDDPTVDRAALGVKYRDAMRVLAQRYPDDPDTATLFAESALDLLWTYGKSASAGMVMPEDGELADPEVIPALRQALHVDPAHLGANHLLIHALDFRKTAAQALPSADFLAGQHYVPAASHLVHMASHIYFRVGRYRAAIRANQAAITLDRYYLAKVPRSANQAAYFYHRHNATYLAFAAMTAGDWPCAHRAATDLNGTDMPLMILARFEHWSAILARPRPKASERDRIYHMVRGLAFAAGHRLYQAEAERAALRRLSPAIPAGAAVGPSAEALPLAYLDAQLALSQGHDEAAIDTLKAAIPVEDSISDGELLPFFVPFREALGRALLKSGRPAEAAAAFRADLTRTIANPRSQAGLAASIAAQARS